MEKYDLVVIGAAVGNAGGAVQNLFPEKSIHRR